MNAFSEESNPHVFTLTMDWLAFTLPAASAPDVMRHLGGDWTKGTAGFPDRRKTLRLRACSSSIARDQVTMLGAFVEVWLAKEGHHGEVGINLLTKVQFPNLAVLYGSMLAGVDYVLMGAGIPRDIPGILDALATSSPAAMRLEIEGAAPGSEPWLRLDPAAHWGATPPVAVTRPRFRMSCDVSTE